MRKRRTTQCPLGWWPPELQRAGETLAASCKGLKKVQKSRNKCNPAGGRALCLVHHPHHVPKQSSATTSLPHLHQYSWLLSDLLQMRRDTLPSSFFWSFLSFISIQTISPSPAKLYIVPHSSLLQTQYPPWPSLARFHLPCCVCSSPKILIPAPEGCDILLSIIPVT